MYTFGPKRGYDAWKESEEDRKKKGLPATTFQPVEKPKNQRSQWERDLLKDLSVKKYGRSYNDKFANATKELGIKGEELDQFRNYLDAMDKGLQRKNNQTDSILNTLQIRTKKAGERIKNDSKQKKEEKEKPRSGFNGFLDQTLGRASHEANKLIFGKEFVKKQDEVYQKIADKKKGTKSGDELQQRLNTVNRKAETKLEKGADIVGKGLGIGSYIAPGVAAEKLAIKGMQLGKGTKAGSQIASLLSVKGGESAAKKVAKTVANRGIKGAGGGLIFGVGDTALKSTLNPDDYKDKSLLKQVMLETAIGGVADPLIYGGGQVLKAASNKTMKNLLPSDKDLGKKFSDILLTGTKNDLPTSKPLYGSLPDRLKALNPERKLPDFSNAKPVIESPNDNIIAKHFGVDAPAPKKDILQTATPEYWRKRYEDFADHVKKNYDMNQMTKEGLDDLWSQFAKYDEPIKLDELAELAYKDYKPNKVLDSKEVWDKLGNRPSVSKNTITPEPKQSKNLLEAITPLKTNPKSEQVEPMMKLLDPTKKEVAATSNEALKQVDDVVEDNIKELQKAKDIFSVGSTDLYRLAEKLPKQQQTRITSSLDAAKKSFIDQQEQLTNELYENVVKGLGIKKGSKESALVQDYGEKTLAKKYLRKQGIDPNDLSPEELGEINLQQLKKVSPKNWKNIVAADEYFRKSYDSLIDQVNNTRAQLYPNNPEKLVPRRNDYYHHFKELEGFEGVRNLFDTPANIDPHLEGISQNTKPKSKYQSFMQKRGTGKYKSDALGGYLKYIKAASHSINVDPVIPVLRNTAEEIADATANTMNLNKTKRALEFYAGDLAGKTNPYDRSVQEFADNFGKSGRKIMTAVSNFNSKVKANMVLGNVGSALGQVGNVPLGIGKAKLHSIPGLVDTLGQTAKSIMKGEKNAPIYKSQFLKERFSDQMYRKFDHKLIEQPKKFAAWMMETADKAGSNFIWNSMYRKGLSEKVADPIKYADYETRKIVAGRGVGEVPLLQKSKAVQILAPFTLEVGNQWRVLKEMVGAKDAAGIVTFLFASYGLNKAVDYVRGSGISLDPVDAIVEGYQKGEGSTMDKITNSLASLNGEIVGNIPGGNLLTNMVNTEKKIPFTNTRFKELFGERDPNRFGSGLTLSKPMEDPLYGVLPFGANQIRKSFKGVEATKDEGVYKDNPLIPFTGSEAELKFPIKNTPVKNVQAALFGPNALPDAKEYYNKNRRPLSEKQTETFEALKKTKQQQVFYDALMLNRMNKSNTSSVQKKIRDIMDDSDLSTREKQKEVEELLGIMLSK